MDPIEYLKRIGFIINSRRPEWRALGRGMRPWHMATGWPDRGSPMYFMRFGWIAEEVNRSRAGGLRYELYRPWRDYDAVVFLKSMEHGCAELVDKLRSTGRCAIFEANVDYYTRSEGCGLPSELAPDAAQRDKAIRMTSAATAVLASSRRLAEVCKDWNGMVTWVPDNVPMHLVPSRASNSAPTGVLQIWWSGMPSKTIDLLLIGDVLRRFGNRIRLNIVTTDIDSALKRMAPEKAGRVRSLLAGVPHRLHAFKSIRDLLALYSQGPGVIISPRFLDNAYNASHSEWKISLGMACGLTAIASPQPSYLDVASRCEHPSAAVICETEEQWVLAIENAFSSVDAPDASESAQSAVRRHYSTGVVSQMHADAVRKAMKVTS